MRQVIQRPPRYNQLVEISAAAYAGIFILGLVFGSFFNVAIHRWPLEDKKDHEWVKTPSRCPKCRARIKWYDNVPLLSYLVLGGKCRSCKAPIHWRYPAVELGNALLWSATAWAVAHFGLSRIPPADITWWHIAFIIWFVSLAFLTIVIDFQTQLIPDEITIATFVCAWAFFLVCKPHTITHGWLDSLIGMATLALPFLVFCLLGWMGLGDVLYLLGVGALLGWKLTLTAGFIAVTIGGIVAVAIVLVLLALRRYKRGIPIPFGPYLAIGAVTAAIWGERIFNWYFAQFGLSQIVRL